MFIGRKLVYLFGLVLIIIFLSAFQTVFWFQLLGQLAPPLLWLCVINYVILARREPQSLVLVYLLAIAASSLSSISIGVFLTVIFIYFWIVVLFKDNFYIESLSYFILLNLGGSFLFHVLFYCTSRLLESNPTQILFFDRLTQVLLTPLFSIPLYWLLKKWEKYTKAPEIYMDTARYEYE